MFVSGQRDFAIAVTNDDDGSVETSRGDGFGCGALAFDGERVDWAALAMTTPGPTESPSHGYRSRFVQGR